jgi:threonylcarbamoyladenosine tRNA methylthiotransferase MtaB
MIEELPLTYLHVFTFSARPGTPAATMPNQVPVQVARERNRLLRELAAEKKRSFMRQFVGQKLEAITLNVISEGADGTWTEALTDNYLKMKLVGHLVANRWLRADVTNIDGDTLIGTKIHELAAEVPDRSQTNATRRCPAA